MTQHNIPIVMYHCINAHPEGHPLGFLSFSPEEFRQHLRFFHRAGYSFITMSDLWQQACSGKIGKKRLAVLTFDDGFLDNHLIAADILRQFGARATIFVNPGYADNSPVRTLEDVPNAWGYLNFAEMRLLEKSGIFDIQSHTLTHEMAFRSDRLIDLYDPKKFDKYHWLTWMLHPKTLKQWSGDVRRFANRIPSGYPIFEYDRCLTTQAFFPSDEFVQKCINEYQKKKQAALSELRNVKYKGVFEKKNTYLKRIDRGLRDSQRLLEKELQKKSIAICFPGGAYTASLLRIAKEIGHQLFMRSSRDQKGNNTSALFKCADNEIVGLNRISFSKDYPPFLQGKTSAYWNAKLKVGTFMGNPYLKSGMNLARGVRNMISKWSS
ncbi:MAG: polysaccharide deacetylase family protein [Paludibacter sp.]|nr:polysaccharide deacetylase family protein [Paludibacter sp.]MDD4072530.1 polysaccharide deacetylase family protein [Desulfobacterales bacterium]MDD4428542.1 polysaccharide deacetylase family protein [Paludibacter sp.]